MITFKKKNSGEKLALLEAITVQQSPLIIHPYSLPPPFDLLPAPLSSERKKKLFFLILAKRVHRRPRLSVLISIGALMGQ